MLEERICINPNCKKVFFPNSKNQCLCNECFESFNIKIHIFDTKQRHDCRKSVILVKFGSLSSCQNCGKSLIREYKCKRNSGRDFIFHTYCSDCFQIQENSNYNCLYDFIGCKNKLKEKFPVCSDCCNVENKFCPICNSLLTPPANKYVKYNDDYYCSEACIKKINSNFSIKEKDFQEKNIEDIENLKLKFCFRCKEFKKGTLHEIYPRKYGGKRNKENQVWLCDKCHDYVEIQTYELFEAGKRYTIDELKSFILSEFPIFEKFTKEGP